MDGFEIKKEIKLEDDGSIYCDAIASIEEIKLEDDDSVYWHGNEVMVGHKFNSFSKKISSAIGFGYRIANSIANNLELLQRFLRMLRSYQEQLADLENHVAELRNALDRRNGRIQPINLPQNN